MLFNPRSLNNKIGDFIGLLEDKGVDIAFISETWLSESKNTTTAALKAHGYSILHVTYKDHIRTPKMHISVILIFLELDGGTICGAQD